MFIALSLTGGKSESNACLADAMATAMVCFDDMKKARDDTRFVQNHCILICNSAPYSMPVFECTPYENKTVEQMAVLFQEVCNFFCFSIVNNNKFCFIYHRKMLIYQFYHREKFRF